MIEIQPKKIEYAEVALPGSKSFTHRMMITAALSEGFCILSHWLKSEDTLHTLRFLILSRLLALEEKRVSR